MNSTPTDARLTTPLQAIDPHIPDEDGGRGDATAGSAPGRDGLIQGGFEARARVSVCRGSGIPRDKNRPA